MTLMTRNPEYGSCNAASILFEAPIASLLFLIFLIGMQLVPDTYTPDTCLLTIAK